MASALVISLGAILAEMIGHLSIDGRTWLFWIAFLLSLGAIGGFAVPPLLVRLGIRPRATDDELASSVGHHFPIVSDRLVNTLQLTRPLFAESSTLIGSPAFAMAAFQSAYSSVRDVDFNAIVEERPVKRSALIFFFSLMLGLALFVSAKEEMLGASGRLIHHRTFYQKPAPFTFVVSPGDKRVMRGDSVRLVIVTRGEQLPQIHIRLREEGQKDFDVLTVASSPMDSSFTRQGFHSGFVYTIHAQHPVEYFAESREIESDHFRISVLDHPIVRSLNVEVEPPAYTHQKSSKLSENIGDVAGVAGTKGVFRVVASSPLMKATLVFSTTDTAGHHSDSAKSTYSYPLTISDSIATGAVGFMRSGSYHIDLLDRDSVASEHPIEYTVTVTKDEPPQIVIIEPGGHAELPSDMRLDMLARIHDDFGFRGVRLGYKLTHSKYLPPDTGFKWMTVPLSNYNAQDLDVPYIWNMTPLSIGPEDEMTYLMEVTDNDAVTGPKSTRTPEFTVRVPSVQEIFKRADEEANKAQENMNAIKQDAQELQKKVNEALNEMRQMKSSDIAKGSQDFSKQKDMQQMLERQKQLNDRIDQVAKDLQQMTHAMEQQNVLSPETMQKYQELQELFKQIDSPELKKAMDDLQKAMQKNIDPKKLQDAMQNMKQNEENFRKSIERTANILKKIQAEQKIDELMKSASQLAKQEQQSADSAHSRMDQGKPPTQDQKAAEARKQQDAQKELDRMREVMKDVAEQMKKLPEKMQSPQEMKAAVEALADPSADKDMQMAEDAAQKGDEQRAAQNAQSAAKKMKDAQKKLADLKKKMSESEKARTIREMKQLRDELNRLSKEEEAIKTKAHDAAQNSNVFRDLAEQQSQKKDQLGQTASKAMQLAQKSTKVTPEMGRQMGKAFGEMQKGEEAMTERNQQGAEQSSQAAMTALNKASQEMQQAMQAMQKQGQGQSGGGSGGEGSEGQDGEGGEGEGSSPGESGQSGQGGSGGAMQQFISQINKMAQQQQALNNQMAGMAQGQGGNQGAQKEMMRQQAMMSKLSAQQEAVKKSIEQLADEQRQSKTGVHQAVDDLRKIADEMQQTVGDMRSNGVRPETIQRQERILSRLLQAQRSVHERDKDQERESKPGEDVTRESPRDLNIQSPAAQKELQDEMLHSRQTGYTPDYNALIRKYFESLEKK